jgi:hypothetical protein
MGGGEVGLAGGPFAELSVPTFSAGGALLGAAAGVATGLTACSGGAASKGSGEGGGGSSAQDKKLTQGEIQKLKNNNINPEELKEGIFGKGAGKTDLYKTPDGDIVVKGKGGVGPGEPTGININNLH